MPADRRGVFARSAFIGSVAVDFKPLASLQRRLAFAPQPLSVDSREQALKARVLKQMRERHRQPKLGLMGSIGEKFTIGVR